MAGASSLARRIFFPGVAPYLRTKALQLPLPEKVKATLAHPAGPFTIHFWAPAFKWGICIANLVDIKKQKIESTSVPQQTGVCIWFFVVLARWIKAVNVVYLEHSVDGIFCLVHESTEKTTLLNYIAVAVTGLIWSRYSMVVIPKNWNLFTVNMAMAVTGLIQLCRVTLYKMQQAKEQ